MIMAQIWQFQYISRTKSERYVKKYIFGFCRNGHEQSVRTQTMKIIKNHIGEGSPPQGLSEARRGKEVFAFTVPKPRRGRPFGDGGVHHNRAKNTS
jgi:hypothetical protein